MNNPTWLSPRQAGELTGFSARHIQNLITRGELSANKEDGKYQIERSELFRMFPDAHTKEQNKELERNPQHKEVAAAKMEMENQMLKEIASQKDREIEFLRKQLESYSHEKSQMLTAITHHARLLEHKESSKSPREGRPAKGFWKGMFWRSKD